MIDPLYLFLFTKVASTAGFVAIAVLIGLWLAAQHKIKEAAVFSAAVLGLMASVTALKEIFQVPRPDHALIDIDGYAFPSGHAAGVIFLGLVLWRMSRSLPAPLRLGSYAAIGLSIVSIGLSRIVLGVHTEVQVLAGYAIGAFWSVVYITYVRGK